MTEKAETRDEIMARYASGIQAVENALAGLTEADLGLARAQDKWTIRQIVHHITETEILWEIVIRSALGNCGCLFDASWYIVDNGWAEPLQYATRPVDGAFTLYKAIRHQILELLEHVPDPWEKYVLFHLADPDQAKKRTVGDIVAWISYHARYHVEQMLETREVHGR